MALVKREAVPPVSADGGRVDIGRADERFLPKEFFFIEILNNFFFHVFRSQMDDLQAYKNHIHFTLLTFLVD